MPATEEEENFVSTAPRRRRRRRRNREEAERAPDAITDEVSGVSVVDEPTEHGPLPNRVQGQVPLDRVDDDAVKVIRRLRRHGHAAYLVGGGVRDLLLGIEPKDFDIATSARPQEVRDLFRNCRIIGRRFRLAHILFSGGKVIEVATFRRDPMEAFDQVEGEFAEEMDALRERSRKRRSDADLLIRHDNVFGEPHEDAVRRDFTINGLFYDTESDTVLDYVGGIRDLRSRLVKTIGAPDVRFREDPVRMLRAIKFSARLDLGIDPQAYDAIVAQAGELTRAARPRLLEEVLRLLRGGAAHRSFWLLWETGGLGVLLPTLAAYLDDRAAGSRLLWDRLDAIDTLKRAGSLPGDPVLLAALMLGPIEEVLEASSEPAAAFDSLMVEAGEALALPRRMKERMRQIVGCQRRLRAGRLSALSRRDYVHDAVSLFTIECDARHQRRPEWLDERLERAGSGARRRRRRRRPA